MSHHDDIASLLEDFYASIGSGKITDWEDHIADDAVCIGTDEHEWMEGKNAILPLIQAQVAEMSAAGISVTGGSAVTSEHGDMVVISDRPTIHLPDGSSQTLRATLAGRRVDGEVLIHQMHMSAPAPNAEVVQTELTLPTPLRFYLARGYRRAWGRLVGPAVELGRHHAAQRQPTIAA